MNANRSQTSIRTILALLTALLVLASIAPRLLRAYSDSADQRDFHFSSTSSGPREVEPTTEKAIQREYAAAWKNMADALSQNRVDLIDQSFVGAMHDQLAKQIDQQKKTGISTRYIDHGHNVNIVFYSPEGTALELRDTAEVEQQILDGGKTVHSEQVRQNYLVIFTLVEDRWKVRLMQAVPTS